MFGVVLGRHPLRCSHGACIYGSWCFNLSRIMMVHSLLYVRPLDVAFLGHGASPNSWRIGCLQIYSLFLRGLGIVLLYHGTWSSGITLGFPITCILGFGIYCHNRVDLTCSFLGISYPYWNGQVYSRMGAHTLDLFQHGWMCMWSKLMEIILGI